MTVKISSIGLKGLEGYRVQVQVQVLEGKESMVIVGLPDTSVKESKERVLSAMHTLDCDMTDQKIVVNLSPSEQKKNSPFFDLAIAIGILKERGEFKEQIPDDSVFIGALVVRRNSREGRRDAACAHGSQIPRFQKSLFTI